MNNNNSKNTQKLNIFKRILNYSIKTLNGMAYGLFATLIVGTIIKTLGQYVFKIEALVELATVIQGLMGIGIGVGIAWSLNLTGLKLIVAGVAGGVASGLAGYVGTDIAPIFFDKAMTIKADPIVIYLAVVGAIELMNLILRRKTPIDIIIIPLLGSLLAFIVTLIVTIPVAILMNWIGDFIILATNATPFFMGIIIAVVMGMALTAPISSAAIAIAIKLGTDAINYGFSGVDALTLGIAGGAALTGCCVQMLGFAVMSRKDNNIGTVISVGIGTSMLQFKNILKKPIIWLPTIIVSAILGPLSTVVFKMTTTSIGAGMGTSGIVGQIATIDSMGLGLSTFSAILILQLALPIILVYILDVIFRKFGLIKTGDLKI